MVRKGTLQAFSICSGKKKKNMVELGLETIQILHTDFLQIGKKYAGSPLHVEKGN